MSSCIRATISFKRQTFSVNPSIATATEAVANIEDAYWLSCESKVLSWIGSKMWSGEVQFSSNAIRGRQEEDL